jgi:hypothetical protein
MLGQRCLEMGPYVHLVEIGFINFPLHHRYFESPALICLAVRTFLALRSLTSVNISARTQAVFSELEAKS